MRDGDNGSLGEDEYRGAERSNNKIVFNEFDVDYSSAEIEDSIKMLGVRLAALDASVGAKRYREIDESTREAKISRRKLAYNQRGKRKAKHSRHDDGRDYADNVADFFRARMSISKENVHDPFGPEYNKGEDSGEVGPLSSRETVYVVGLFTLVFAISVLMMFL